MLIMARRILTYFTMLSCLLVGTVVYRQFSTVELTLTLSNPYTQYLSKTQYFEATAPEVMEEVIAFAELEFTKEEVKPVPVTKIAVKTVAPKPAVMEHTSKHSLPFHSPVVLTPVYKVTELEGNNIALYKEFSFEGKSTLVATKEKEDAVSTIAAAPVQATDEEPVFFEYEAEKKENATEVKTTEVLLPTQEMKTETPVSPSEEIEFFDLVTETKTTAEVPVSVTTQTVAATAPVAKAPMRWEILPKKTKKQKKQTETTTASALTNESPAEITGFLAQGLSIQVVGSDLKGAKKLNGFEVRFMDDYSEILDDYGSGTVTLNSPLSTDEVQRSARILKRGFTPTNTDLILESSGANATLPLIDEDTFNELLRPYESNGPMGALLIELDDETQLAQVDVPFMKVLHYNDRLEETAEEGARYQLFVGIRAGNALVTYHHRKGHSTNKIVAIQNHELTFENNLYASASEKKISLWEENLLSKEKKPLVMATASFKRFVSGKTGKKISQHEYSFRFPEDNFAARRYFELGHLPEPVFVGTRNNFKLEIPSENFMRYVLNKLDNAGLANRCIVQVNLRKTLRSADVGSESVEESLLTHVQTLDADGQFYDTPSDSTRKLIVLGESHAPAEISPDGKINLKLSYTDGTVEYLSSYCSPNTYVVEQL